MLTKPPGSPGWHKKVGAEDQGGARGATLSVNTVAATIESPEFVMHALTLLMTPILSAAVTGRGARRGPQRGARCGNTSKARKAFYDISKS